MKKMLIDRMVNLLSRGCVVPVVCYIKQCWQRGDTDISLIRYFVTEVNYNTILSINYFISYIDFTMMRIFTMLGLRGDSPSIYSRICTIIFADGRK